MAVISFNIIYATSIARDVYAIAVDALSVLFIIPAMITLEERLRLQG